jgi:hypothetical protein
LKQGAAAASATQTKKEQKPAMATRDKRPLEDDTNHAKNPKAESSSKRLKTSHNTSSKVTAVKEETSADGNNGQENKKSKKSPTNQDLPRGCLDSKKWQTKFVPMLINFWSYQTDLWNIPWDVIITVLQEVYNKVFPELESYEVTGGSSDAIFKVVRHVIILPQF